MDEVTYPCLNPDVDLINLGQYLPIFCNGMVFVRLFVFCSFVLFCFTDIVNDQVAQATLLDDDISTCMILNTATLHKEFEWIEMEMRFYQSLNVIISGHRLICQRTICDGVLPVLLYHQEWSTADCGGGSNSCSRYTLCELLSEVQSKGDGLAQCSYRCLCNHSSEKNCHNFRFLFDRKMNTLQTMPIEICEIRADTFP